MKPSKPYVLGLTGGIACGKSYVARLLRQRGIPVLDADAISRSLTAEHGEALPAIRAAFGDRVFGGDALNRRALGNLVFSDAAARRQLEEILHPMIIGHMQRETEDADAALVAWDVPLLYETGMDAQCDEVWCVSVPLGMQVRRVMRRDGLSRTQALQRMQSQMPLAEKRRRADHVIDTSGNYRSTNRRVRGLLRNTRRSCLE